jgi:threonine synthase
MESSSPRYVSTRGTGGAVSFREAWQRAARFDELGAGVLAYWLRDEVPEAALQALVQDALDFPVPLVPLHGDWEGVSVLELFHGPTLSFKDFGARMMARLMSFFLRGAAEELTILVATSGDTGSAVADGFAGQDDIRVVLLYPKGQVSPVQERQLVVARPGVQALAVDGTFDDCQRLVKEAFADADLARVPLSSANSINIGRLLPQMLYYLWAIRQAAAGEVVFCVPSGNLGNLTGGVLAALSGAPVRRFVAAHNANDFFPRHLAEGLRDYMPSVRTYSSAMDVGVPSNFERLDALLDATALRQRVWGTSVTDDETLAMMRTIYYEAGYVADPHTAVGLEAARRYRAREGAGVPLVVLSTAHPAKFPEIVRDALGVAPEMPERLAALWRLPTRVDPLPPALDALKEKLLARAGA